jgi:hypothetical protein
LAPGTRLSLSARISSALHSLERILDSFWLSLFSTRGTPLLTRKRIPPQHTQDIGMQDPQPTPRKRLIRTVEWVIGLTSLALALAGFWLSYVVPKLSVDAYGSLRPTDPMSTAFYLSNDGALPIHSILVACGAVQFKAGLYEINSSEDSGFLFPESRADTLSPGHKMTLPCSRVVGVAEPASITRAEMTIIIKYSPDWLPWVHKTAKFPWKAQKTETGWIWNSLPR